MKMHPVNFLIAVAVSALIAYGLWSVDGSLKNYVAVGSFVFLVGTLAPGMGIQHELARRAVNLRIVCMLFFVLGLAINTFFALYSDSQTAYIIVNTIVFLIYVFFANMIFGSRQ